MRHFLVSSCVPTERNTTSSDLCRSLNFPRLPTLGSRGLDPFIAKSCNASWNDDHNCNSLKVNIGFKIRFEFNILSWIWV